MVGFLEKSTRGNQSGVSETEGEDRDGAEGFGGLAGMSLTSFREFSPVSSVLLSSSSGCLSLFLGNHARSCEDIP